MLIDVLQEAVQRLTDAGIEGARLDAEVLFAHAIGCDRFELYAKREPPDEAAVRAFETFIRRRAEGCPVAYITGIKEFWSMPIRVSPAVLIPRPETEIVVECALALFSKQDEIHILDLCTGSGCIAAALAKELPRARFVATDASAGAIAVARANLAFAVARTEFHVGDLFAALCTDEPMFDLITSNPPYIPTGELGRLPCDIAQFEPRQALDGGKCGLDFAARIIEDVPRFLKAGGWLVMEMGAGQGQELKALGEQAGFGKIVTAPDLAGIERVICLWKSSS